MPAHYYPRAGTLGMVGFHPMPTASSCHIWLRPCSLLLHPHMGVQPIVALPQPNDAPLFGGGLATAWGSDHVVRALR